MTRLHELLELLESMPADSDSLTAWRVRIDAVDQVILRLLNRRSDCANEIGRIKKTLDMPVYVPRREEEVLRNVMENNPGPLPDTAVRSLFERIIDETRSLERHRYQDDGDQNRHQDT